MIARAAERSGFLNAAPDRDGILRRVPLLAEFDGHPVAIRDRGVLACAFHPELTDDLRLHALFMAMVTGAADRLLDPAEERR